MGGVITRSVPSPYASSRDVMPAPAPARARSAFTWSRVAEAAVSSVTVAARPPPSVVPSIVAATAVSSAHPMTVSAPPTAARAWSSWSIASAIDGSQASVVLRPSRAATSPAPRSRTSIAATVDAGRCAAMALAVFCPVDVAPGVETVVVIASASSSARTKPAPQTGSLLRDRVQARRGQVRLVAGRRE